MYFQCFVIYVLSWGTLSTEKLFLYDLIFPITNVIFRSSTFFWGPTKHIADVVPGFYLT